MAIVYTVAQQKGGAGKTTLAANLAAYFAGEGQRVALLDIDPQRSLTRWHALRGAARPVPAAIGFSDVAGWRLAAELERLKKDHDVVVIDTPPQIDSDARVAIRHASLVVVPMQPSPPDLWAAEGTLKLAAAEKRLVRVVLNRTPASSKLRSAVERDCITQGLAILKATIGNRAGFAHAFAVGLGVSEYAARSAAAEEIRAVAEEIKNVLF